MTRTDDRRLNGRWPEFSVMSRRPGIGLNFLHDYASAFMQFNLDKSQTDVPVSLRHGRRELPLGRYARMRLRRLIGRDEKTPQEALEIIKAQLSDVRKTAFDASRSLALEIKEVNKGKVASFHARNAIYKTRRSL